MSAITSSRLVSGGVLGGRCAPRRVRPVRPGAGLRLTQRGQAWILAAAVLVVLVGAMAGWNAFAAGAAAPQHAVIVQPGQTLSQVAHEAMPQMPVGNAVAQIQIANHLNSLQVQSGQKLLIP